MSFAQANIISRHNSDLSWLNFLQRNMVSVTMAPEKASACLTLTTATNFTLNTSAPTAEMLFNALASTPLLQPDAIETKTYRWGETDYVITVFSAKRLETLYKRELINNKAK